MRLAATAALLLHAAALALLVAFGTKRPRADAEADGNAIEVVFSTGASGEVQWRGHSSDTPWAEAATGTAPAAEGEAEASVAQPMLEAGATTTEETEFPTADPLPSHKAAASLPLPPAPPPEPPTPRQTERPAQRKRPAAEGGEPWPGGGSEAESRGREASAAGLVAHREATVSRRVDPVVPVEARRARIQGTVVLAVTVSPQGVPSAVDVIRSSGHVLLDRAAEEAVWQWRFDPARRGGVPVAERIAIPISFRIVD